MRYGRLYVKYRYDAKAWQRLFSTKEYPSGNIGDPIQCIAVEEIYKSLGIDPFSLTLVNRDELDSFQSPFPNNEQVSVPIQAWCAKIFGVTHIEYSNAIYPIFIGFHLSIDGETRSYFIEKQLYNKLKDYQPIGCRDRNTAFFLQSLGLDAYFSSCLTLTFPTRTETPSNSKVFFVDVPKLPPPFLFLVRLAKMQFISLILIYGKPILHPILMLWILRISHEDSYNAIEMKLLL